MPKRQENGTCCFCVHVLDFIITSLCFRISMSELHSDGIGEAGCVITALYCLALMNHSC